MIDFLKTKLSPKEISFEIIFGVVIILTILEMAFDYFHNRKIYSVKDIWTNFYLTICGALVGLITKSSSLLLLEYCYQNRAFQLKNTVVYWVILIVFQDFLLWLLHYLGHQVRLVWAMHVMHHSSEKFNLTTGFRSVVFEPLYRVIFYLPLSLMGFNTIDILFVYMISQFYGTLTHTQLVGKLHPWFEYIFVTPSHHRVHHASNVKYLDKNMGMVLILWDRWFGTFQEELEEDKIKYGLTTQPTDTRPINIIFHEFIALNVDVKRAPTFMDKVKYIFNPPGWSHDGSTKIAKVMQKQLHDFEELEKQNDKIKDINELQRDLSSA